MVVSSKLESYQELVTCSFPNPMVKQKHPPGDSPQRPPQGTPELHLRLVLSSQPQFCPMTHGHVKGSP